MFSRILSCVAEVGMWRRATASLWCLHGGEWVEFSVPTWRAASSRSTRDYKEQACLGAGLFMPIGNSRLQAPLEPRLAYVEL